MESAEPMTDTNYARGMANLWSDIAHVGSRKCLGHLPIGVPAERYGLSKETAANFARKDQEWFWSEAGECILDLAAFFVFNRAMVESAIEEHKAIVRRLRCRQEVGSVLHLFATRWFPDGHFAMPLIQTLYGNANWEPPTPDEFEWLKDYPSTVAQFNATTGIEWGDFIRVNFPASQE